MATMVPPQKNVEYIFYVSLVSQANTKIMQSNPTLAAGDAKVSTDGNALSNLDTLPDVDPDASYFVKVVVSATEMNGDNIAILFHDAADDEWCDLMINIQTGAQSLDATDAVADGIQTDLSNATDGLGALKALIDAAKTVLDDVHDTDLPAVKSETALIVEDTGTTLPTTLATIAGYIDTEVQAILDDLANATDGLGALKTLIDALNNLSAAQVNAEMVDVLGVDTLAELSQGKPTATPTIKAALMLVYMIARNKLTSTSSELSVYKDDGTKIAKKALSDDGAIFTEAEMESGA